MYADGKADSYQPPSQSLALLIGASVLFHLVLLFILNQGFTIEAEKKAKPTNKINARLVFSPPKVPIEVIEPVIQEIEKITAPASQVEDLEVLSLKKVEESKPEDLDIVSAIPEQPTQQQADVVEKSDTPEVSHPNPSFQNTNTPRVISRDLVKQHLRHYNAQKNQQMAQSAAQQHRQQTISPQFPAANVDPFKTEEEKFQESLQVKADCSSTANKTVSVLAGIFGGNIKCSKPPPFQQFIDKRLNKTDDK